MTPFAKTLLVTSMMFAGHAFLTSAQPSPHRPARVAFYYGFPSLVNGARGNIQNALAAFSGYDMIVLGDGVEFNTKIRSRHPVGVGRIEYQRTKQIIQMLVQQKPQTEIFGYICLGDTQSLPATEIQRRIELWKALGVTGIFFDEAGYDWRIVTRQRQNSAINHAHALNLQVFLNAYHPISLLSPEKKTNKDSIGEDAALRPQDVILLESFPVKNGIYVPLQEWRDRLNQALKVRALFGSRIVSLATGSKGHSLQDEQLTYSCWNVWMFDLDGMAWSEPNYSSDSSLAEASCTVLDSITAKGSRIPRDIRADGVFSRETADGLIVLDVNRKTVHMRKAGVDHVIRSAGMKDSGGLADVHNR